MRFNVLAWAMLFGIALCACNRQVSSADFTQTGIADTLTHHAKYLTIADSGNGVVLVDIADPWNEGKLLGRYALIDSDSIVPTTLDNDIKIIRTPITHAAVFSSVHTHALDELGALSSVVAIADRQYFTPDDTISFLLENGTIADLGSVNNPSVELMAARQVKTVLRSPMQGVSASKYPAGIIPIECADYMETSPIGRAEWILLFGELTGRRTQAKEVFETVIDNYSSLVLKASSAQSPRLKILAETEYSGLWYVPGGKSYMARIYADAGGEWPWADTKESGSLSLSLEDVASKALDADIWFVRSYGYDTTKSSLKALNPRYTAFKAWKEGNVYSCNTKEKNIFNDAAFHPDRVLAEYVAILHPEVMPEYKLQYFKQQQQ